MSNIERSRPEPSESKKKTTCGGAGPVTRTRLLAAALTAAALFGAAPAVAQLRINLEPGADVRLDTAAAPDVRARGEVLRVGGNGSTIVIWPIAAARVGINVIVIWPRAAAPGVETGYAVADLASIEVRAERDSAVAQLWIDPEPDADVRLAAAAAPDESVRGNGNTVVIWPRAVARVGINTIVVWPRDAARVSGNGSTVIVWPRTAARVGINTVVIWPRDAARVGGNGSTIVVWPRTVARVGGINVVVIWPRTGAPGVETDYDVADLASLEIRDERDR